MKQVFNNKDETVVENAISVGVTAKEPILGISDEQFNTEKSTLVQEVDNTPKVPKQRLWKWTNFGQVWAYILILFIEICILTTTFYFLIPLIGINFSFVNALALAILLSVVRKYWKD